MVRILSMFFSRTVNLNSILMNIFLNAIFLQIILNIKNILALKLLLLQYQSPIEFQIYFLRNIQVLKQLKELLAYNGHHQLNRKKLLFYLHQTYEMVLNFHLVQLRVLYKVTSKIHFLFGYHIDLLKG